MNLAEEIINSFETFTLYCEMKYNPNHAPAGTPEGGQFAPNSTSVAVATFQSTQFDAINNELRYDKPDKYKEIIKQLDEASTDVTDGTLFRGVDANYVKTLANKYGVKDLDNAVDIQKFVGKTLTDKGFTSTSKSLSVAADFARDKGMGKTLIMQISGKKRGINILKHVNNYRAKKEKEFVLKRGSSMVIKRVSLSKTKKLIFYTDMLP